MTEEEAEIMRWNQRIYHRKLEVVTEILAGRAGPTDPSRNYRHEAQEMLRSERQAITIDGEDVYDIRKFRSLSSLRTRHR
jgi:hypothetical protein